MLVAALASPAAVCSINLYGRHQRSRPTSLEVVATGQGARPRILQVESVTLPGAQPYIHKAGPRQD